MNTKSVIDGVGDILSIDTDANEVMIEERIYVITEAVNKFLGFIVVFLVISITVILVLEIIYLMISTFRDNVDNRIKMKGDKAKIRLILRDAIEASKIYNNSDNTGRTKMDIYIAIKIKSLIIFGVVITLLVGGNDLIVKLVVEFIMPIIK